MSGREFRMNQLPALNPPPTPAAIPPVSAYLTNRIKDTEEARKRQKLDPSGATDNDVAQIASEIGLQAAMAPVYATLREIQICLAQATNASATRGDDFLVPVLNTAGVLPHPFPTTKDDFEALPTADLNRLLDHYNLPRESNNDLVGKRNRLKFLLRIRS